MIDNNESQTPSDSTAIPSAEPPATSPAPAGPVSGDGALDRLIGIFSAPGATFERIVARPSWALPFFLLVVAVGAAGFSVFSRVDDREMEQSLRKTMAEQAANLPSEQIDRIIPFQIKMMKITQTYGSIASISIYALIGVLFYWAIFRAFGANATFGQTFSVFIWGSVPMALKALIAIPVSLMRESIAFSESMTVVRANASFLVDPSSGGSKFLYGFLVALDLFAIWVLVLRLSGMRKLPGVSKNLATTVAVIAFVIYVLMAANNASKMV